jgi:hypothetical protein
LDAADGTVSISFGDDFRFTSRVTDLEPLRHLRKAGAGHSDGWLRHE